LRIAYLVDVHGHPKAVADAVAAMGDVELLVIGGDITTGGTVNEAVRALDSWRALAPHLLAVAGNMDSQEIDARLADLGISLDGRGVKLDDVGDALARLLERLQASLSGTPPPPRPHRPPPPGPKHRQHP
jgi:Icc-related predicted phosphoesterase